MGLNPQEHYCDHCGMLIRSRRSLCAVHSLPIDVSSACAGESATLCKPCYDDVMEADGRPGLGCERA